MIAEHTLDLGLLLLFLPLVVRLIWDWYVIVKMKIFINHVFHTWITVLLMWGCACAHSSFLHDYRTMFIFQNLFLSWGIFFLLFDYLLNISRGLGLNYVSLSTTAAYTDQIFRRLPWYVVLFLKLVVFGITVSVYFYWGYIIGEKQFQ